MTIPVHVAGGCRRGRSARRPALLFCLLFAAPPALGAEGAPRYDCRRPALPGIPIGEDATRDALAAARSAIDAYLDDMQAYVDCLKRESDDAVGETEDLVDRWETSVRAFEARSGG